METVADFIFLGSKITADGDQGKLEVVKQEMLRVNVGILGISELKWTRMGEINSDDHYIYYCGQEQRRQWHPTPVLLPGKSHG